MKIFLNKIIYGDSCSGKTFLFKKYKKKKIDLDLFLKYKNIILLYEFFFRILEKKISFVILKIKKKIYLGGGSKIFVKNYLIFKNNTIFNQFKRLIIDNYNRPTLKSKKYLKIRFCIRKKKYLKLNNFTLNNCINCNLL
ncbi:putative shikimate kinase I [Candidatus Carsonella ruddii HT isolate Thao2000]|uniref:Putative shikimate kinase I n=1 Tax=Candidatus Carsonella ruddii HT isolate Thao2000 TaxID=1202539 RepID=J3YQ94_CARRU|nr:hypothetical protein [Candidatus Carsonella ruddii]AFP84073.1 putative shikimate kinase I [Candidatus Carsonella ruddii HT isolate Thao2000]